MKVCWEKKIMTVPHTFWGGKNVVIAILKHFVQLLDQNLQMFLTFLVRKGGHDTLLCKIFNGHSNDQNSYNSSKK